MDDDTKARQTEKENVRALDQDVMRISIITSTQRWQTPPSPPLHAPFFSSCFAKMSLASPDTVPHRKLDKLASSSGKSIRANEQ